MNSTKTITLAAAVGPALYLTACSQGGENHRGHGHGEHARHAAPADDKVEHPEPGKMGKAPTLLHTRQEVRSCCEDCGAKSDKFCFA